MTWLDFHCRGLNQEPEGRSATMLLLSHTSRAHVAVWCLDTITGKTLKGLSGGCPHGHSVIYTWDMVCQIQQEGDKPYNSFLGSLKKFGQQASPKALRFNEEGKGTGAGERAHLGNTCHAHEDFRLSLPHPWES